MHMFDHLPGEQGAPSKGLQDLLGEVREENYRLGKVANEVNTETYDMCVVGGGIVGLATARELIRRFPGMTVCVLEKEAEVSHHQTGHNSGVIHSGIYYKPGTEMAYTCVHGADLMYQYAEEHHLPVDRCGKLIVATDEKEHKQVELLYEQGNANGVKGLEIIYRDQIRQLEPNVDGYSALVSPNTGIISYWTVCQTILKELQQSKRADVKTNFQVKKFTKEANGLVRVSGSEIMMRAPVQQVLAKNVITCAGLYADRVSGLAGGDDSVHRIVTFRGQYYQIKAEYKNLVQRNVYPVPSGGGIPVGVHFTPTIDPRRGNQLIIGPGACFTFSREGYRFFDTRLRDVWDNFVNKEFWGFAFNNLGLSFGELYKDLNKRAFLKNAHKMIPDLTLDMVELSFAGVMSQVFVNSVAASDFIVERKVMDGSVLNVRNAPSPAATASLAIGEMVVKCADEDFGLSKRYC
ncbi:FAD dependent oxidoreductase [Hesseltinella vesiculosa]|uniref:L-2-hydroxyglutarate dehydrogenase, mitochondrial n=1 Tax=Hesseltinella vesiculosa TaxID=101127 RepID=A0A1X2GBA2_9FUNG|nr:FAD dependent oxidoreductase [Hesseltinella vesiculosa]